MAEAGGRQRNITSVNDVVSTLLWRVFIIDGCIGGRSIRNSPACFLSFLQKNSICHGSMFVVQHTPDERRSFRPELLARPGLSSPGSNAGIGCQRRQPNLAALKRPRNKRTSARILFVRWLSIRCLLSDSQAHRQAATSGLRAGFRPQNMRGIRFATIEGRCVRIEYHPAFL